MLLGHRSLATTTLYAQVSMAVIGRTASPFDQLHMEITLSRAPCARIWKRRMYSTVTGLIIAATMPAISGVSSTGSWPRWRRAGPQPWAVTPNTAPTAASCGKPITPALWADPVMVSRVGGGGHKSAIKSPPAPHYWICP